MKTTASVLLLTAILSNPNLAQDYLTIPISQLVPEKYFIDSADEQWDLQKIPRVDATVYERVLHDSIPHIKAVSNNSASGWRYNIEIDPKEYPIIEWQWKVDDIIKNGDMTKKSGDDYAARIYITFDYNRRDLPFRERIKYGFIKTFTRYEIPLRALNFIWANNAEVGTIAENPFTNWVNMVAVESGKEKAGKWVTTSLNVYDTYKEAFGEEPKKITGVAIMTDTDNTGSFAIGYYGDLYFRKKN